MSERPSKLIWLGLAVVLGLGAYLRAYDLGGPCFDQDELYAVRITGLSPKAVVSVVARDGLKTNHPPLMTVPYLVWTALFGTGETAVRALPCLAGVLALGVVFRLGWVLAGPRAGLIAAAVLAINPLHISYSQEARQYALLVLLVALAHLLMLKCLSRGKWYDLLAYLVISTLALLTHYFAAPALLAHLVIGLWLTLNKDAAVRTSGLRLVVTLGLAGLSLAAWLPMAKYQSTMKWGHLTSVTPMGLLEALAQLADVGWPGIWMVLAVMLVGWFWIFGLFASRDARIPVVEGDGRGPLPRWFGAFAVLAGLMAVAGTLTVVPQKLLPVARKALEGYQYDAATIDTELGVIERTILGYSLALAFFGVVLVLWKFLIPRIVSRCQFLGFLTQTPSAGGIFHTLTVVPFVVVALAALLGIPVFSVRNMIVVGPAVALGLGVTGEALLQRSWSGKLVFSLLAGLMIACVTRWDVVTAPFGIPGGPRLGLDTPDWKQAAAALPPDLPVMTVNHPTTDPLLYYAADRTPARVKPDDPFDAPPPVFVYVHWPSRADSKAVLEALRKRGYRSETVAEFPELTVVVLRR